MVKGELHRLRISAIIYIAIVDLKSRGNKLSAKGAEYNSQGQAGAK
jgi:hypothetical protein